MVQYRAVLKCNNSFKVNKNQIENTFSCVSFSTEYYFLKQKVQSPNLVRSFKFLGKLLSGLAHCKTCCIRKKQ